MMLFTVINLAGAKLLSESNSVMVIWKTAIPLLTVVVLLAVSFHGSNFNAGGGFFTKGAHGIFAALPAGVVAFSRRPPEARSDLVSNWANPVKAGATLSGPSSPPPWPRLGPYATIATAAGAGWLATLLYVDAFISPAGTGLVCVGTSARLSYAIGEEEVLPEQLTRVSARGVPYWSILLAFVIGEFCFLPFPSWQSLVGLVTSATAIMYAFAPVSLAALALRDPERERPYRLPAPKVLAPVGFISANLIIYWSGFEATWKILTAIFFGRVVFEIALRRRDDVRREDVDWRAASWIWPWLVGLTIIGLLGRYGKGAHEALPDWVDLEVVIVFSLVIFSYAVSLAMSPEQVKKAVEMEERAEAHATKTVTA